MAETDAKIMAMVERAVKKDPAVRSRDLYQRAVRSSKAVGELSVRQFHARYALAAKRKLAPPKPRKRKTANSTKKRGNGKTGRSGRATRSPGRATSPVSDIVEARIKDQRAALADAAAAAVERAMKSGHLSDIDRLGNALAKAERDLAKI